MDLERSESYIYPVKGLDHKSGESFWKIKEVPSPGLWFFWPGIYRTEWEAREAIAAQQQDGR